METEEMLSHLCEELLLSLKRFVKSGLEIYDKTSNIFSLPNVEILVKVRRNHVIPFDLSAHCAKAQHELTNLFCKCHLLEEDKKKLAISSC